MMKGLRIGLFLVFCVSVVVLMYWSNQKQNQSVLKSPEIFVKVTGENAFLTEEELSIRLTRGGFIYAGMSQKDIQLKEIENFVSAMTEVKSAKVYTQVGNDWNIDVEIRKPICRIYNAYNENFYLDELGVVMNPSELYTARVVVVTGEVFDRPSSVSVTEIINNDTLKSSKDLAEIYRISKYVCNDPFLSAQIGQIERLKNGDFVLIPQVGDQKIIFGAAKNDEDVTEKFKKLIIFYKEGLPFEGWNTYEVINLKYRNQIVCKKKGVS